MCGQQQAASCLGPRWGDPADDSYDQAVLLSTNTEGSWGTRERVLHRQIEQVMCTAERAPASAACVGGARRVLRRTKQAAAPKLRGRARRQKGPAAARCAEAPLMARALDGGLHQALGGTKLGQGGNMGPAGWKERAGTQQDSHSLCCDP